MQQKLGIAVHSTYRTISGAKVFFDKRSTAEVCDTRSDKNDKAALRGMRKRLWEIRQADKRLKITEAA